MLTVAISVGGARDVDIYMDVDVLVGVRRRHSSEYGAVKGQCRILKRSTTCDKENGD
jgi:hypothetical protein